MPKTHDEEGGEAEGWKKMREGRGRIYDAEGDRRMGDRNKAIE